MSSPPYPPVLVIAGTSSNVGKTTITCSIISAFTQKGLIVQPFKIGPDFLDAKHHTASCNNARPSINLDGWLMGGRESILKSFYHHARGADICVVEGVMGLFDAKSGKTEDGSTAQVAKWLNAPVILVVDASCMARSVAAMVFGYTHFDTKLRLAGVIVNKINGQKHRQWIQEALLQDARLVDVGTNQPVKFIGHMPLDKSIAIPERHLGLQLPTEQRPQGDDNECYLKLGQLASQHLDLDSLLELARTATPQSIPMQNVSPNNDDTTCLIAIARDDAFHFYYHDNFALLEEFGAQLVYFSPIHDAHLPAAIDAIYIGGGYPELFAQELQENESMRLDIQSFALASGVVYAECGGLLYLSTALWTLNPITKERQRWKMCNVLPNVITTMTPHMKLAYADICVEQDNRIFVPGTRCRGQEFHFSEVVEAPTNLQKPFSVSMDESGLPQQEGYSVQNVVASYFHFHWASQPSMAKDFVSSAIRHSPIRQQRNAFAVSFVSTATEIAFALGAEAKLAGVTSVCDYPAHARSFPRQVFCSSPFDATQMTSEEVATAMQELRNRKTKDSPPGHWIIDKVGLKQASPRIAFVQESCEICDASKSDVLSALDECGLADSCETIQISPTTLDEMFDSMCVVGEALGVTEKSKDLCDTLRNRLNVVEQKLTALGARKRPRVLSLEGLAPLCVGGGWLPDVKFAAGCEDAMGDVGGAPARILQWKDVATADPDVLVISPCSASPVRTLNELHLLNSPEFWNLRCVQKGDVYVIDHGRFSRPGPRLVEAIEILSTLLCNLPPPEHINVDVEWNGVAFKYECCVGQVKHCTTELATRFRTCFGNSDTREVSNGDFPCLDERLSTGSLLQRVKVTPCSIPNNHLPCDRSAHNMVALRDGSVLLFAGDDDGKAGRHSDVWKLCAPNKGWDADLDLFDNGTVPRLGYSPVWERMQCSSVADENVPTRRSNSAAVVCGDHLLVFGGWGQDSECLDNCELLHLETFCWTHCSTRGEKRPSARGNPTLVYSTKRNEALLFGGWNKVNRLDELWILNMNAWEWTQMRPVNKADPWPLGRTDHTSVLWTDESGDESMLVFGGSVQNHGSTSEMWQYSLETSEWKEINVNGPSPSPRTSHCAAIVGNGDSCKMIVLGGTGNGSGRSSLPSDAWILSLSSMEWTRLSWTGSCVERCRHGMVVADCDKLVVWGGYNGESVVKDEASVWLGSLEYNEDTRQAMTLAKAGEQEAERKRLQERWEAEVPIRESDLPPDLLEKAKNSSVPGALFKALHRFAVSKNRDTYIDPATGYSVFTQTYLKRRACCGNGCRHCPYGHVNVPTKKNGSDECCSDDEDLDW